MSVPFARAAIVLAIATLMVAALPAGDAAAAPSSAKSSPSNTSPTRSSPLSKARPDSKTRTSPRTATSATSSAPDSGQGCLPKAGGQLTTVPWPQQRLDFQQVWTITQGAGVRVAVIDTGMDQTQPQMAKVQIADAHDVLGGGFPPTDIKDCNGHGTGVTGIIAAPQVSGSPFVGVAPGVTIIPIKQSDPNDNQPGGDVGIADGIDWAVTHGARVINISSTVGKRTAPMQAAIERAKAKQVIIVAAAGNDGTGVNAAAYPAAYSTSFDNVIAVSASNAADQVPSFSARGNYVTVCAPGVGVIFPARQSGYTKEDGTSFATPYVTGTVALMLAAHPSLSPGQVRSRLEATADPPPASVPDHSYGYGTVNPYRAVTAVNADSASITPARAAALPGRATPRPVDRHLQHLALGVATALVLLAVFLGAGAMLARRHRAAVRDSGARRPPAHVRAGPSGSTRL